MAEWGVREAPIAEYRGWYIYPKNRWGLYAANRDPEEVICLVSAMTITALFQKIDKEVD